ncbi:MAG: hypothetical protein JXR23_05645, partial [Pontiellaceae bacterium]|nr:hypothetical protein [Pontiellaceae bacterium]
KLRFIRPDLRLIFDDRFFDEPSMKAIFHQTDWIVMPYLRSEYSSGILAHAAGVATPVIAPDSGLLGRLVRQNQLGICLSITPEKLAKCIDTVYSKSNVFDESKRQNFVQKSDPFDFVRFILDALRRDEN